MFDLARIGAGLPVAETIESLPSTGNVVIQAPPGTGKTTVSYTHLTLPTTPYV